MTIRHQERMIQTRLKLIHERRIAVILNSLNDRFAPLVAKSFIDDRSGNSMNALFDDYRLQLQDNLTPAIQSIANQFGSRLLPKKDAENIFVLFISEWLSEYGLERAIDISNSQRRAARNVIVENINLEIEEIAKKLVSVIGDRNRAMRIARTETLAASSIASHRAAGAVGERLIKEWSTAIDGRQRPSHNDADGQRVAFDDPFTLVDSKGVISKLMYPGDPNGPPNQIINCRCSVLYWPIESGTVPLGFGQA